MEKKIILKENLNKKGEDNMDLKKTAEDKFNELLREVIFRWRLWVMIDSPSEIDYAVKFEEDLMRFIKMKKIDKAMKMKLKDMSWSARALVISTWIIAISIIINAIMFTSGQVGKAIYMIFGG